MISVWPDFACFLKLLKSQLQSVAGGTHFASGSAIGWQLVRGRGETASSMSGLGVPAKQMPAASMVALPNRLLQSGPSLLEEAQQSGAVIDPLPPRRMPLPSSPRAIRQARPFETRAVEETVTSTLSMPASFMNAVPAAIVRSTLTASS